jgi:hypothetical protein
MVARIVPVSDGSRPTMLAGAFLVGLPRALADRGILADLAALGDEDTDTA